MFQASPPTNFAPAAINAALRQRYKSKVNQLLLAFTVDRWASHTNTVLDFEQMFCEQQEQSNFHSKLATLAVLPNSNMLLLFMQSTKDA